MMRFKIFFCSLVVLGLAGASSQAAITLMQSLSATQPTIQAGGMNLVAYDLRAVSDSGQLINTVELPVIVPNAGGMGLHQVALAVTNALTPTRAEQVAPLWSDTWLPYDSYWLFDGTNSLSVGGAFTETNSMSGGAALPTAGFGVPNTGFGGFDHGTDASKAFIGAIPDSDVTFAQLVMKEGESVLVSMGVFDNTGDRAGFTEVCIGACGPPPTNTPPDVTDFVVNDHHATNDSPLSHQFAAVDAEQPAGPFTWDMLSLVSYTPNYGADAGAAGALVNPTLSTGGLFDWNSVGSTRGDYVWSVRANDGQPTMNFGSGTITVHVTEVPEPATFALFSLAMVGLVGVFRRR